MNEACLKGIFIFQMKPNRPGRPSKSFTDSNERTRRRQTEEIWRWIDDDIIVYAIQTTLRTRGKRDFSKILKEISNSPTRTRKYKKTYLKPDREKKINLTPLRVLALFVEV